MISPDNRYFFGKDGRNISPRLDGLTLRSGMAEQASQIVAGSTIQDYDGDIPSKAGHAL